MIPSVFDLKYEVDHKLKSIKVPPINKLNRSKAFCEDYVYTSFFRWLSDDIVVYLNNNKIYGNIKYDVLLEIFISLAISEKISYKYFTNYSFFVKFIEGIYAVEYLKPISKRSEIIPDSISIPLYEDFKVWLIDNNYIKSSSEIFNFIAGDI